MAFSTKLRDLASSRRTLEGFIFGQLQVVLFRVSSMTGNAAQPKSLMDIQFEALYRSLQLILKLLMAVSTGIRR